VKTPDQALSDVERRLTRTWAGVLTGSDPAAWPHAFPLGQPDGRAFTAEFDRFAATGRHWRQWAQDNCVELTWRSRLAHNTPQELPTHLHVPDIETAARLSGDPWTQKLHLARTRYQVLAARYSHVAEGAAVLRTVTALSELDFELLCRAADWFAVNDATGLTPRQVPIEGMHAKWLNTRQALVRALAGIEDLRVLPPHPARIHFTYLDPGYRSGGGRHHDSATVGDGAAPAYQPRVVIISENKDSAIHMPPLADAISVEGVGKGGSTAAAFGWITGAEHVFYWGDMDADGFEILDGFRAAGVPATSILMDMAAYAAWERYGTNDDPKGQPLKPSTPKALPHLTSTERELYDCLTAPDWDRYRRVEQERIPMDVALSSLIARLSVAPTPCQDCPRPLATDRPLQGRA
jgi:hypothetical protein